MFLMEEKCIRGGIFHAIYQYTKANNKYMKDYEKNIESSYLMYWDVNRLSGLPISLQMLPVGGFKWVENTSQCSKDFIKLQSRHWWRIFSWSWCWIYWKIR